MSRLESIVRPGSAEIHAAVPQAPNSKITPRERVILTDQRNTPAYIKEEIARPDNPRNVAWIELGENGAVQTINPLQAWREGGKMINAVPAILLEDVADVPTDERGRFPTNLIYDGEPMQLQVEYARQILGGILSMEDAAKELYDNNPQIKPDLADGMPTVVVMENANRDVSDRFRHSSRTLATQHGQILLNGFGVNTDVQPVFSPALQMEHSIKDNYEFGSKVVGKIDGELKIALEEGNVQVDILQSENNSQRGYTIQTSIKRDGDLTENARELAAIMQAHYPINERIITEEIDLASENNPRFAHLINKRGINGYANRHTYYFGENSEGVDTLHVYISPALLGGGATEDHQVAIDRGPDFPQLMPGETRKRFDRTFAKGLEKRLDTTANREQLVYSSTN